MKTILRLTILAALLSSIILIHSSLNAGSSSIKDYNLRDTTIKVIWREDVLDKDLKEKVNSIKLNENYFANISDPEKAVLGYLASTIGNECYSDGSKSNIKCKILSALNLGYQCSEANKTFLRGWFKDNPQILSRIENCKPKPTSPVVEKTFDEVTVSTKGDMVKVNVKGLILDFKENTTRRWTEDMSFKVNEDKMSLLDNK